jgi:hypothetical protein
LLPLTEGGFGSMSDLSTRRRLAGSITTGASHGIHRKYCHRKLRACDLVKLRVRDVCHGQTVASRTMVLQQKAQRPVQFEITEPTREGVGPGSVMRDCPRRAASLQADFIYRRTSNLRAVQLLLGHAKLESTVRYLGIRTHGGKAAARGLG